jgi:NAD(P)-dependent dehydrogenase (short-subunit alcohol dehydrogenase family)
MLTMCLAAEWARYSIGVSALEPGLTRTEFSRPIWDNAVRTEKYLSAVPQGRVAEPDEIVGAVLFLGSDAARFIAGQSIYVDGGFLAS